MLCTFVQRELVDVCLVLETRPGAGSVPRAFAPRVWGRGAGLPSTRPLAGALPFSETALEVISCQPLGATSFPSPISCSGKPAA